MARRMRIEFHIPNHDLRLGGQAAAAAEFAGFDAAQTLPRAFDARRGAWA